MIAAAVDLPTEEYVVAAKLRRPADIIGMVRRALISILDED